MKWIIAILLPVLVSAQTIRPSNIVTTDSNKGNILSGPTIVTKLNNIQMADQISGSTADVQLNSANTACISAGGGTIDARGYGATMVTIASTVSLGNSSNINCTLLVDRATIFNVTISNGTNAFEIWPKTSIIAFGSHGDGPSGSGGFHLSSAANVSALIASKGNTGGINTIQGIALTADPAAVVSRAMLDLVAQTDMSTFTTLLILPPNNGIGIRVESGAGSLSVGPIVFINPTVNCQARAGCKPVLIAAVATGGAMGGITFLGGSLVHPGTGGLSIIDIEGGTANNLNTTEFYGTQIESSNTGDIGINCVNCLGLHIQDVLFTNSLGVSGADCIKISQSGGVSYNITIDNVTNYNSWTNTINDTINSITLTGAANPRIAHYTYAAPTSGAGSWYVGATAQTNIQNAKVLSSVDGDGGGLKHKRVSGCTTGATAGNTCTTTVTWTTAFSDANYTPVCTLLGPATLGHLAAISTDVIAAASVKVETVTDTNAAISGTVNCVAIHD